MRPLSITNEIGQDTNITELDNNLIDIIFKTNITKHIKQRARGNDFNHQPHQTPN